MLVWYKCQCPCLSVALGSTSVVESRFSWHTIRTSIRTPYKWYKTSFKMGLDYVLKGPSDYLQKVKRHRGVTQKNPFRWFEITVFSFGVFWIFLQPFFDFKTKASSFLFLLKGCMLSRFFFLRLAKKQLTQPFFQE